MHVEKAQNNARRTVIAAAVIAALVGVVSTKSEAMSFTLPGEPVSPTTRAQCYAMYREFDQIARQLAAQAKQQSRQNWDAYTSRSIKWTVYHARHREIMKLYERASEVRTKGGRARNRCMQKVNARNRNLAAKRRDAERQRSKFRANQREQRAAQLRSRKDTVQRRDRFPVKTAKKPAWSVARNIANQQRAYQWAQRNLQLNAARKRVERYELQHRVRNFDAKLAYLKMGFTGFGFLGSIDSAIKGHDRNSPHQTYERALTAAKFSANNLISGFWPSMIVNSSFEAIGNHNRQTLRQLDSLSEALRDFSATSLPNRRWSQYQRTMPTLGLNANTYSMTPKAVTPQTYVKTIIDTVIGFQMAKINASREQQIVNQRNAFVKLVIPLAKEAVRRETVKRQQQQKRKLQRKLANLRQTHVRREADRARKARAAKAQREARLQEQRDAARRERLRREEAAERRQRRARNAARQRELESQQKYYRNMYNKALRDMQDTINNNRARKRQQQLDRQRAYQQQQQWQYQQRMLQRQRQQQQQRRYRSRGYDRCNSANVTCAVR